MHQHNLQKSCTMVLLQMRHTLIVISDHHFTQTEKSITINLEMLYSYCREG